MKEKIEIALSKNKLILLIGASFLFVVLGVWIFINAYQFQEHSSRLLNNPYIMKGIGVLGILFFGIAGAFGVKKLFDNKTGLLIDSRGITDNTNASSIGLIEWNDILNITKEKMLSNKFLLIHVKNPEKYIEKAKNKIHAKIMRSNMKMYGTPISITSTTLKYNFVKLEGLLQTEFKRNKNLK